MEDADLIEEVAREFIARKGAAAITELEELAEIAADLGDTSSQQTWLDIAHAASRILQDGGSPLP